MSRPLPHSPDAEKAVLGSIYINNDAFYRVIGIIGAEHFYVPPRETASPNRILFSAFQRMTERNEPIEYITLKEELNRAGEMDAVGGLAYVSALMDAVPDIANVERYAKIIKAKATLRALYKTGAKVATGALESSDPVELLAMLEAEVLAIAADRQQSGFARITGVIREELRHIEQVQQSGRDVTGLSTGFVEIDRMTAGLQPEDVIILAARPSQGKTSLAMGIAENAARGVNDEPKSVAVFSLEMGRHPLMRRMLSSRSGVPAELLRTGHLSDTSWSKLARASADLSKLSLHVDDTPALDILDMRARARQLKSDVGLDLVVVDYLQLMTAKGRFGNRQEEVAAISRGLKAVAKELHIPVLALSQLSRASEQRTGDHRPRLSDLRETGQIEQDADVVMFIYRDEVYNKDTVDKGIAEIIFAKQRNGPIGDVRLAFLPQFTRFANLATDSDLSQEAA